MRFSVFPCLLIVSTILGCGQPDSAAPMADAPPAAAPDATLGEPADSAAAMEDDGDSPAAASDATPGEPADATTQDDSGIALTPENTVIQFVGTHADPAKPDPRTGKFTEFAGTVVVEGSGLKSVNVEIVTKSLTTDIEKLTNHLKSPDFFDVNEHPKATFTSTSIKPGDDGSVTITGDLTLLGETKSLSFPATVSSADGFKLSAEFTIDRTQFGMNYGTDNVLKEVQMTVTVDG